MRAKHLQLNKSDIYKVPAKYKNSVNGLHSYEVTIAGETNKFFNYTSVLEFIRKYNNEQI